MPTHRLALTCVLTAVMALVAFAAPGPSAAQGTLPTTKLTAGVHLITAEVAATDPARSRGLMFREKLAPNHGMLFIFDGKQIHCMWMRNTLAPLDMVFIAADGRIHRIAERTVPLSLTPVDSRGPVRATLELQGGITEKLDIRVGDRVLHRMFGTQP